MTLSENADKATRLLAALGNTLDYDHQERSFSPFYSDLGLGFNDQPGIAHLYLHYNRRTTQLGEPFLSLPGAPKAHLRTALSVEQKRAHGTARFAFCTRNTWLVDLDGSDAITFRLAAAELAELRRQVTSEGYVIYDTTLPNTDRRDPDERFPFVLGLRVIQGTCTHDEKAQGDLTFTPDDTGKLLLCFSANMLDVDHAAIAGKLTAAPNSFDEALALSQQWLNKALGHLTFEGDSPAETAVLAKAAFSLAFNACQSPGMLAGRTSAFPSRGNYPVHYLWDSCFQNLALEHMDPDLAPDSLLLLTENLRQDGKMYHFIASTWPRPHASQPPLVGWAGLRLVKQRNDLDLARRLLPALMRNNAWWLTQRMTRYGVITCPEPLETGWDDTPRLDEGPVLALDMNSHLLLQMRCCVELARMIGDRATEAIARSQADSLAGHMVDVLYDPADNLFKDVLVATGQKLPIKTPACFLPLLAGVPIDDDKARRMIEDYLLNPKYFFGQIPFPCVAYDEPSYQPEKWWRGPVWLAIAYLMLEAPSQVRLSAPGQRCSETSLRHDHRGRRPPRIVQQPDGSRHGRLPARLDRRHLPEAEDGTKLAAPGQQAFRRNPGLQTSLPL